jgi:hypothetical protein
MAQVRDTGLQSSDELSAKLAKLSPAQAAAVPRIVAAELAGSSVESLFNGPHKICSRSTYYRQRGWVHKAEFQAVLEQARREIRNQNLLGMVNDAISELKATTPLAARDLRRQIVGDQAAIDALLAVVLERKKSVEERNAAVRSLAVIATPQATDALLALLSDANKEVRLVVIEALGISAAGTNVQRRLADIAVLDRADKLTASKVKTQEELDAEIAAEIARVSGSISNSSPSDVMEPAKALTPG